ncbi:nuclear transport factor 2 family protein [Lampropedia aestuarii]|uniref:nuclear transport factor 2 family protein n=1 Tax=Lampropedia aestuarii TaxID=2562762 RepID=UPI0031456FF5
MNAQSSHTQLPASPIRSLSLRWPALLVVPLVIGLSGCSSLNFFSKSDKKQASSPAQVTAGPAHVAVNGAARDLAQEEANRALVLAFYEGFFNQHQVDAAAAVVADDYIQHNPFVPNGKAAFVEYFRGYFKEFPESRAQVMRSATDGDLVYLHVHSTSGPGHRGEAVVDIFRVKDGRITEHWDVIQEVPERPVNTNTMF